MDRKSRTSQLALEDTNEELNLWKRICGSLAKLENIQKETETALNHINKIHDTVNLEQGISSALSLKLKHHYQTGINLSLSEVKIINDIVEKVSVLIALREASENSQEQRRKKRKSEADELKNSGSPSKRTNSILTQGTMVAARQPNQKDKNEEWILAVVIRFHSDKNKYQVEDVDQDETGQKQRYMLSPRNIIPVRDIVEPKQQFELSAGQNVLALYPGTTCFYKAVVIQPPSKNKEPGTTGNYKVRFEDDNNQVRLVRHGYVLELPKAK